MIYIYFTIIDIYFYTIYTTVKADSALHAQSHLTLPEL